MCGRFVAWLSRVKDNRFPDRTSKYQSGRKTRSGTADNSDLELLCVVHTLKLRRVYSRVMGQITDFMGQIKGLPYSANIYLAPERSAHLSITRQHQLPALSDVHIATCQYAKVGKVPVMTALLLSCPPFRMVQK
jgi:hypothetical protein